MKIIIQTVIVVLSSILISGCADHKAQVKESTRQHDQSTASVNRPISQDVARPAPPSQPQSTAAMPEQPQKSGDAVVTVRGMSCPLCANNIEQQLKDVPEVTKVSVDLGKGQVIASLSSVNNATKWSIEKAIRDAGFTVDRVQMP